MKVPVSFAKGQSMTEFLVALAFFAPIMFMLPTMANLLSVQTEAHKASRYVAWERTAYSVHDLRTEDELAEDIETRFLTDPESSFGIDGKSTFKPAWRDFKNPDSSVIDVVNQSVVVNRDTSRSATADSENASAWLAGRGGRANPANAVQLDTMQTAKLSIPLNAEASVFQVTRNVTGWFHEEDLQNARALPADPIAGTNRLYVASSSALVADGWAPSNEQMFQDRVEGMNTLTRPFQRGWEGLLGPVANIFDELEDRLYVGPTVRDSLIMTDSRQSGVLPSNLKEYVAQ